MTTFSKLNLKEHTEILVLNSPASFEPEIARLDGVTVRRALADVKQVDFSLAFVTTQKEVDSIAKAVARKAAGDAVVWFAYPKSTSKKYTCEFNRDNGWAPMGDAGFEPVRMVAIDADWSALRFRRVGFIKTLTRDKAHIMSAAGKARAGKGR
jgi:hypothetical protein